MAFRQIFLSLKKSKLLLLLLAVFFVKQLFMVAIFPMFQGPDEPVHYATIQNSANRLLDISQKKASNVISTEDMADKNNDKKNYPKYSEEISNVYNLVGVSRVSFHSRSTQIFSSGMNGKNEDEVKNNNWKKGGGKDIVADLPGYYFFPSCIEKILSKCNIFIRFFGTRIFSIFLGILIILFSYLSAKKIGFDDNISILLTALIGFQPIFSQSAAITNYDIMLVFAFSLFIFGSIWILKNGLNWKNISLLIFSIFLGIFTKAPAIVLPIVFYFLMAYFIKNHYKINTKKIVIGFIVTTLFLILSVKFLFPNNYFASTIPDINSSRLVSINKYISTTMDRWDWSELSYWGNFGWLDTAISSWIVNLAHWIEIAGILGIIAYFFFPKKVPEFLPKKKYIWFLIGIFLGLQFAIRFADWNHFNNTGKIEIGTPGRYFIPVIFAQFSLIVIGIGMLARKYSVWKNILKILALGMIMLWIYSVLIIIIPRYYL